MSSTKIADYIVNAEWLNTSICLTCHFFGTVPHFDFGIHADTPINPLYSSISMDYELASYPTDAKTKHCRINAILQIVSQSSSCYFMFKIKRLILFITKPYIHTLQTLAHSWWRGKWESRKLTDHYFSTLNSFQVH